MSWTWNNVSATIAILAAFVGFVITGPGNVQYITQALFYIFAIVYFVTFYRSFRPKKPS